MVGPRFVLCLIALLSLLSASGCRSLVPRGSQSLRLGYLLGSESVPILVAQEGGFFAEEGLDVELVSLTRQRGTEASLVASGALDGSDSSKVHAIAAISQGVPVRLVGNLVGSGGPPVFTLVTRADIGIGGMQDLEGRKLTVLKGGSLEFVVDLLLQKYAIDRDAVQIIDLSPTDGVAAFRAGRVDVMVADPVVLEELKQDLSLVELASSNEVISNSYIDGLIFSKEFIDEHPETVASVLRAVFRAGRFANENEDQARKLIARVEENPAWQTMPFPVYATDNAELEAGVEAILAWMVDRDYLAQPLAIDEVVWVDR